MFETEYPSCPNCGFNKKAGFFNGSHFFIYKCSDCGSKFCHECSGSNGARKCPDCSSTRKTSVGKVYLHMD